MPSTAKDGRIGLKDALATKSATVRHDDEALTYTLAAADGMPVSFGGVSDNNSVRGKCPLSSPFPPLLHSHHHLTHIYGEPDFLLSLQDVAAQLVTMSNPTLGIKDPKVFDLPKECKKALEEATSHPEARQSLLLRLGESFTSGFRRAHGALSADPRRPVIAEDFDAMGQAARGSGNHEEHAMLFWQRDRSEKKAIQRFLTRTADGEVHEVCVCVCVCWGGGGDEMRSTMRSLCVWVWV